jgi:hypothetical protein
VAEFQPRGRANVSEDAASSALFMSCSSPSSKMPSSRFCCAERNEVMSGIGSKSAVAALVLATTIVSTATKAENGQIAAGIAGGLIGGALIGGALAGPPVYAAPPPPPVYYEPSYEPAPVVVEEPACRLVREQFWDGYGYRVRRYRVCD